MSDAGGDTIAQVAVVVLLLGLAVPSLATAYDYAGTPFEFQETATVDYATDYDVSANATLEGYGENVTIRDVDGEGELEAGTDYRWNESTGTVTWLNSSSTTSGESVTVTYEAYQRTAETSAAWSILSPLMAFFGLFGLASAVRAVWRYAAEVFEPP